MDIETVLTLVLVVWGVVGCFSRLAAYTWVGAIWIIGLVGVVILIKDAREFNANCDGIVDKLTDDLVAGKLQVTRENLDLMMAAHSGSAGKSTHDDYPYFLAG